MRTKAQLRTDVLAALGFIDPFATPSKKALGQLRAEILLQLGSATQISVVTRTLSSLRGQLMAALGFAAQAASPPPGMETLLDTFINNAQDTLWRRLELDRGATSPSPARLVNTSDATTLDGMLVLNMAIALGKAHYGKNDAKPYLDFVDRYLLDWATRVPPASTVMISEALGEAQHTAYRRYEMAGGSTFSLNLFTADSDETTIDHLPVYLLALGNLKARLGQPDAKVYLDQYERYMADLERRMPANANSVVTQLLESAHRTLYRRYNVLRTERFFTWTLVAGQNMYELNENDEQAPGPSQCLDVIDPREITWAGIERDDQWYPLTAGIPPECYSNNIWSAWPSRYEVRQCIEIWPSPGTEVQKLRMKGHAELGAFATDSDEPNIDDEALYLLACGQAKLYYKQPDHQLYIGQLEAYISNLVAGAHQTRRYVPGGAVRANYVEPRPLVPFS